MIFDKYLEIQASMKYDEASSSTPRKKRAGSVNSATPVTEAVDGVDAAGHACVQLMFDTKPPSYAHRYSSRTLTICSDMPSAPEETAELGHHLGRVPQGVHCIVHARLSRRLREAAKKSLLRTHTRVNGHIRLNHFVTFCYFVTCDTHFTADNAIATLDVAGLKRRSFVVELRKMAVI